MMTIPFAMLGERGHIQSPTEPLPFDIFSDHVMVLLEGGSPDRTPLARLVSAYPTNEISFPVQTRMNSPLETPIPLYRPLRHVMDGKYEGVVHIEGYSNPLSIEKSNSNAISSLI
jgi:hypothetical protein